MPYTHKCSIILGFMMVFLAILSPAVFTLFLSLPAAFMLSFFLSLVGLTAIWAPLFDSSM